MKRIIKLTESDLHRIIKESISSMWRESGFHDDIDYNSIYDAALDYVRENNVPGEYGWDYVAEELGFDISSYGQLERETLRNAIEDAMNDVFSNQQQ